MSSKPGFWGKCRFAFRCARFTVWAAVLLLLAAYAWLNVVGLPGFLKTRLVAALRERGVQLEFTRMRLHFYHGLACDNVRIGEAKESDGPVLTAREVQLRLDYPALFHRHLQIDGLVLHRGNFEFPLSADDSLTLTNLESELRFENDDTWSLDHFKADFAGVTFTLGGEIAHAPEFQKWKMFASAQNTDRGSVQSSLKSFSDALKQIHFEGKPQLMARLNGDARDVHSFTFSVDARAPGVQTPWFGAHDLEFAAHVIVPTDAPLYSDPAWGFWTNLQPFRLEWTAHSTDLIADKLAADAADCGGVWSAPVLAVTNLSARLGGGGLKARANLDVATRKVSFTASSSFDPRAIAAFLTDKARERLSQISWTQPPQSLISGSLVLPAWTNSVSNWRRDIEPSVRLHGQLAFTNASIAGVALVGSAHTHFDYANFTWTLPDLAVVQGRTSLDLTAEENDATKDFRCVVSGRLDAESLQPFFATTNAAHGFAHLRFRQPAALMLDATGNLLDFATLSVTGRIVATDFAIRDQWVDSLQATLTYTNLTAEFYHPQMTRANGTEAVTAEKVTLDLAGQKLFLHGASGRLSLAALGAAIGPKTAKDMEPYQFLTLPNATAEGCIPLKQNGDDLVTDDADLWVHVVGTAPFRWLRFQTPRITGDLHWLRNDLILTNVVSECYGGEARGWAIFDTQTPGDGTDFSFAMAATNVDFNAMGRALWSPTNQLRGLLSGKVVVTSANSSDWRTWDGYGQMQLQQGLLWNAPIFGLVSSVLNSLTPGLDMGNSRATEGAGRFTMTNGVIFTDSLEIRSLTMRLQYTGTVDLQENVNARARAQLLRNTPVIGSLFSAVLWPVSKAFECGITGTLEKPKISPVYIPFANVLTAPFHPIRTVQDIFSTTTNNPAGP